MEKNTPGKVYLEETESLGIAEPHERSAVDALYVALDFRDLLLGQTTNSTPEDLARNNEAIKVLERLLNGWGKNDLVQATNRLFEESLKRRTQ